MSMLSSACGLDEQCPAIERAGDGMVRARGWVPGATHTPENEREVDFPDTLVPGLATLEIPDFTAYAASLHRPGGDRLRIQTLRQYGVPSDQDYFIRYMEGRPGPTDNDLAIWGGKLRDYTADGSTWRNVHVVEGDIGDYLRYQFEVAYTFNVRHGMDIRIVDASDQPAVRSLLRVGDFWTLERQHVVRCNYDNQGRPLGTVGIDATGKLGYLAAAEMAWELGTPFSQWWAAHPQYHRAAQRAA